MRLFLASQDFGNHADRLREMVGRNNKALVVFNARDAKGEDYGIEFQKKLFAESDLKFEKLDLRDYFGKEKELRKYIDKYQPGLIVLLGGNTFLLRRAMKQSGLDEILKEDIGKDKYVLAGHSAGSMAPGPSLHGYEMAYKENLVEDLPGYSKEIIWDGLGFTKYRIITHGDSIKYKDIIKKRKKFFEKNNDKYIVLNDSDVYILDGDKEEVLR